METAKIVATQPPQDKLRALGIVALNGMFDENDARSVIQQANELLDGDLAIVSSFGADSSVLLHFVSQVDPNIPVLFLETGKHFPETLDYVETLKQQLGLTNVIALAPSAGDLERFDPKGQLWETDPDSCCHIRKTEPLNDALAGYAGWVTGRKRFQTSDRGVLPHFELTSDSRIKINPLAYWRNEDVEAYRLEHNLPEHPLYRAGYKSIGCAPCTSAVAEGEDPRSGRWRGLNKTECGIHFDFNGKIAAPVVEKAVNLFKDGKFIADPWRQWHDGDDAGSVRYTHVPAKQFVAYQLAFSENPHPLGLLLEPDDRIEDFAGELHRFSSIAIAFPAFTDGRGYSTARLLTERLGYKGEVRAIGDVLADQIAYMWRCGVNALVVTNGATKKALEKGGLATVSVFMQPMVSGVEVPVGTRPFLRRAANKNA
jgi:phosphoadenosine phosphosulfate reductase